MSRGTTIRSIRVSDELWEAAQEQTRAEGRNVADVVRDALTLYLVDSAVVRDALDAWRVDFPRNRDAT